MTPEEEQQLNKEKVMARVERKEKAARRPEGVRRSANVSSTLRVTPMSLRSLVPLPVTTLLSGDLSVQVSTF